MSGIVVASDLTGRGARAVARALALAAERAAALTVIHVIDDDLPNRLVAMLRSQAEAVMREQVEAARAALGGLAGAASNVAYRIEVGASYNAIVQHLAECGADLLVVGEHRRDTLRDFFTFSTVERILRLTATPVLVARQEPDRPLVRLLAAADLSMPSRRAVETAARLFPTARFEIVHAYDVPFAAWMTSDDTKKRYKEQFRAMIRAELDAFSSGLDLGGRVVETVLAHGEPSQAVLSEAERRQSDMIVLGTHGRSGVGRALLGSVAEDILLRAQCDVLAVKSW